MKEYTVSFKKIKLWVDEEIGLPSYSGDSINYEAKITEESELDAKDLSVEFLFPYHASNYGCLSMKYVPNQTKTLRIYINVFNGKEMKLENRLSFASDKITLGINSNYAKAMMEYIINNEITKIISSGELSFYTGANSEIGSSIISNLYAVEILLNLLLLDKYDFDDRKIEKFINQSISACESKFKAQKAKIYKTI